MSDMMNASVAQLFRALPCQGRGRELESLRSHHFCSKNASVARLYVEGACPRKLIRRFHVPKHKLHTPHCNIYNIYV